MIYLNTDLCECCGHLGGICQRCGTAHMPCVPINDTTGELGCEWCKSRDEPDDEESPPEPELGPDEDDYRDRIQPWLDNDEHWT